MGQNLSLITITFCGDAAMQAATECLEFWQQNRSVSESYTAEATMLLPARCASTHYPTPSPS